ncbi:hypothetical protein Lade_1313 [Legionella adelaidensis]|uniref:Uncharacterized protein n=1 Tax=Legionella adelaidensis TaxID=45056 RepID=A0A0W0R6E4_9GAMM|nr:hypothetical protein [Legionella adelaidensis]KTC66655.1 hypothetical protein Lade_1313 [Legionella adelaidensis]
MPGTSKQSRQYILSQIVELLKTTRHPRESESIYAINNALAQLESLLTILEQPISDTEFNEHIMSHRKWLQLLSGEQQKPRTLVIRELSSIIDNLVKPLQEILAAPKIDEKKQRALKLMSCYSMPEVLSVETSQQATQIQATKEFPLLTEHFEFPEVLVSGMKDEPALAYQFSSHEAAAAFANSLEKQFDIHPTEIGYEIRVSKQDTVYLSRALFSDNFNHLRAQIREQSPRLPPSSDFVFKSLRGDELCFYRSFVAMLVNPGEKHPLRAGEKGAFTVTGRGVFKRAKAATSRPFEDYPLKSAQFTAEEKSGFSKFQSTSVGTLDYHSPVFGFTKDNRSAKLAGVFFEEKDIRFSDRLFIYDGGTIGRPYDVNDAEIAEEYAKTKIGKILFSSDQIKEFKQALKAGSSEQYNEALARVRWNTDQSSKIFIASDTLPARVMAQTYAKQLKAGLLAGGRCTEDYQVPIIFYNPELPDLQFKQYTPEEQRLDLQQLQLLYCNPDELLVEFQNNENFDLLLLLPENIVLKLLAPQPGIETDASYEALCPCMSLLLKAGHTHILESLMDTLSPEGKLQLVQSISTSLNSVQAVTEHVKRQELCLVNLLESSHPELVKCAHTFIQEKAIIQPDRKDSTRMVPIFEIALSNNKLGAAKELLNYSDLNQLAPFNMVTTSLWSAMHSTEKIYPLCQAIATGDIELVEKILNHPKYNISLEEPEKVYQALIRGNNPDMLALFLKRNLFLKLENIEAYTPELTEFLIKFQPQLFKTELYTTLCHGNLDHAYLLLKSNSESFSFLPHLKGMWANLTSEGEKQAFLFNLARLSTAHPELTIISKGDVVEAMSTVTFTEEQLPTMNQFLAQYISTYIEQRKTEPPQRFAALFGRSGAQKVAAAQWILNDCMPAEDLKKHSYALADGRLNLLYLCYEHLNPRAYSAINILELLTLTVIVILNYY